MGGLDRGLGGLGGWAWVLCIYVLSLDSLCR